MKIGLALGSGSARGWAHIGVIRALEEANIKVDYIAGTSIGAFVGAFYSSGNLDYLEKFALGMDWKSIISFFDVGFPIRGLLDGEKIYQLVSKQFLKKKIEETKIPFCTVATDLIAGEEVVIKSGNIVDAVRASISLPGIFTPLKKDEKYLVDGGLVNPVPVDVVQKMGADITIAVDLNHDIVGKTELADKNNKSIKANSGNEKKDKITYVNNIEAIQSLKHKYHELEKSAIEKIKNWTIISDEPNIFDIIGNSINIMEHKITQINLEISKPDILIQPSLKRRH
jgi:NTE family protein